MKNFFAVVLGVVLVAAYFASTEAAPANDKLDSVVERSDLPETEEGETTTVTVPSASNVDLPDDVLRQVFSLIAAVDGPAVLLDPASQVCRQWRRLSLDPTFWDRVDLAVGLAPTVDEDEDGLLDAQYAARVLLSAPSLRSLQLQQRYLFDDASEDNASEDNASDDAVAEEDVAEYDAVFLRRALALSRAIVREKVCVQSGVWGALGEDGRGALLALLRRSAPYLQELTLSGLGNSDGNIETAADDQGSSAFNVPGGLQSLEELELSDLNPSQAYAGELANVVFPNLQHLRISESHSGANSPKDFYTDLVKGAAPALTSLKLDFEPSTSEALQGGVKSCQRLQRVMVIYPGPFPALGECTEIEELEVEFRNMKAEQVEKILGECRKLEKLKKLELVVTGADPGNQEWVSAMAYVDVFKHQRPSVRVLFN